MGGTILIRASCAIFSFVFSRVLTCWLWVLSHHAAQPLLPGTVSVRVPVELSRPFSFIYEPATAAELGAMRVPYPCPHLRGQAVV